jgi:hypothetical protein
MMRKIIKMIIKTKMMLVERKILKNIPNQKDRK